jgi:hypothetical protein
MINTKELAQSYMAGARTIFIETGEVMPILAFHGGPTNLLVQLMPNPDFHPSDQAVLATFSFATVLDASHVVAVNESWVKKFGPDDEPTSMERGDLERWHGEGDLSVHTGLLVVCANVAHHGDSVVMTRDVEEDESEKYTEDDLAMTGSYLHRLLEAWEAGKRATAANPVPAGVDWAAVAGFLSTHRAIASVAVIGSGEAIDDVIRKAKAGEN